MGYPIAECSKDGSFIVEKVEGTGGLICFGGVAEQLVYEIQDPGAYHVPDVACDFTTIKVTHLRVRVRVTHLRVRVRVTYLRVAALKIKTQIIR